MRSLVLMEQGLELGIEGERFEIRKGVEAIERVKIADISEVLLFGSISLTPACISLLLSRGIDTVFMTAKGRYKGRLTGPASRNVELRLAQFAWWQDTSAREAMARAIAGGKIANQRNLLLRAQRELKLESLARAIGEMRRLLFSLDGRMGMDSIRGVEGQAAALYFGNYGFCIRHPAFCFKKRTRRPPRDPVNAMLSFGYTLLNTAMESVVARTGLDPMLGSFHSPEYGRASLSLDLIEEFRPILVDSLVLRLVNRRQVAPEDFEEPPDQDEDSAWNEEAAQSEEPAESGPRAVWLGETGRRVFFREWGRRLHESVYYEPRQEVRTLKDIMRLQAYHYARVVKGEENSYCPFVPR